MLLGLLHRLREWKQEEVERARLEIRYVGGKIRVEEPKLAFKILAGCPVPSLQCVQ